MSASSRPRRPTPIWPSEIRSFASGIRPYERAVLRSAPAPIAAAVAQPRNDRRRIGSGLSMGGPPELAGHLNASSRIPRSLGLELCEASVLAQRHPDHLPNRLFSFNHPVDAPADLQGLRADHRDRPDLVVLDSRKAIAEGCVKSFQTNFYRDCQDELRSDPQPGARRARRRQPRPGSGTGNKGTACLRKGSVASC